MTAEFILPIGKYEGSWQNNTGKLEIQLPAGTQLTDLSLSSFCSHHFSDCSTINEYEYISDSVRIK